MKQIIVGLMQRTFYLQQQQKLEKYRKYYTALCPTILHAGKPSKK